eukprot:TRINITY_DN101_c0_g2_i2.p1 TRINITY_DN101_c0_g2~~TRINITY_DN101_c0_g2_i2.p1  ORF type:complete len:788 (-),score=163.46 TRINITY_DN101_c0_g2_i2:426-2789(-)
MTEAAPQRSLFFQPALSRANSAESVQKKANGISPQMQSLTFNSLSAEGDMLLKNANYERAVQSFSKALEYRPGDRGTLVSRSRCYMLMGKTEQAIRDVDKVLEADKTYARGVLQKAESHFAAGDFEIALMFYHRGGKIRPDIEEFRLGIQKAKEAIDDALFGPVLDPGSPSSKMHDSLASRPLTSNASLESHRIESMHKKQFSTSIPHPTTPSTGAYSRGQSYRTSMGRLTTATSSSSKRHLLNSNAGPGRKLLGKLYDDKMYLQQLIQEEGPKGAQITKFAESGVKYLDKREEFWKQQNIVDTDRQMSPPVKPSSEGAFDYLIRIDEVPMRRSMGKLTGGQGSRVGSADARQTSRSTPSLPAVKPSITAMNQRPKSGNGPAPREDSQSPSDGDPSHRKKHAQKMVRSHSATFRQAKSTYVEDTQYIVHTVQLMTNGESISCLILSFFPSFIYFSLRGDLLQGLHARRGGGGGDREFGIADLIFFPSIHINHELSFKAIIPCLTPPISTFWTLYPDIHPSTLLLAIGQGDAENCVRIGMEMLRRVTKMDIPDKPRITTTLLYQLGRGYMEMGRFREAAVYFRKDLEIALEYEFKDAVLRSLGQLGLAYQRMGDYNQAMMVFEKKMTLSPESATPQSYLSIGRCQYDAGEYTQALQYSVMCLNWLDDKASAVGLSPHLALQLKMSAYCLSGCCLAGMNRLREAIGKHEIHAQLAQQLSDQLSHAEALTLMANCYTKLGDTEKAASLQQEALKISKAKDKKSKTHHHHSHPRRGSVSKKGADPDANNDP